MKKLSLILAAVLVLSCLPMGVFASGEAATYTEAELLGGATEYEIITSDTTTSVGTLADNSLKVLDDGGVCKFSFTLTAQPSGANANNGNFAIQIRNDGTAAGTSAGHMIMVIAPDSLSTSVTTSSDSSGKPKQSTVKIAEGEDFHELDKKYTYIVLHDADGGDEEYRIYRKSGTDTQYSYVGATKEAEDTSVIQRVINYGSGFTLHSLSTYLPKEQMTETADIVADGSTLYFEEDFSGTLDTKNVWNKSYSKMTVSNGYIQGNNYKADTGFSFTGECAKLQLGGTEPTAFNVRLKYKFDSEGFKKNCVEKNVESVGANIFDIRTSEGTRIYFYYNGKAESITSGDDGKVASVGGVSLTDGVVAYPSLDNKNKTSTATLNGTPEIDVWYEYMLSFSGNKTLSIYMRKVGDAAWTTLVDNQTYGTGILSGTNVNYARICVNRGDCVDDIIIYKGTGVNVNAPVIANGTVTADGWVACGTPKSEKNRRATVLVALYNADNTLCDVVTKDITLPAGEVTKFSISEPTTASSAKVMVWDSTATLIPLGSSAD